MPVQDQPAITWGTPVVGVFLWLLNESLLGAGTAGFHFRIPKAGGRGHHRGGQPAELGRWTLPGEDGQELRVPGAPLVVTCLLCDHGCVWDIF